MSLLQDHPGPFGTGVSAVFFDLVGTLIHAPSSIGAQYARHARDLGIDADADRLTAAFGAAMAEAPPMAFPGLGFDAVVEMERSWWRNLVERVVMLSGLGKALEGPRLGEYFSRLFDHFTTAAAWRVYDDVRPTLAALRAEGLLVGLITNYDTRVFRVLDALDLSPLIDSVTIPAHAGAAKPDAAIFACALDAHALSPAAATMVGDSMEDDYLGARSAGLHAVLLDRGNRMGDGAPVRRLRSLTEILDARRTPSRSVG